MDKFSNWVQVFTGKGGAHNLISLLGQCFHSFGLPETLTSDGGSEYIAADTKEFLRRLGVHHRLTSVGFPHANQKAERSVGTAKRVIRDAVKPNGELDTVTLVKGLLTLRNTPDRDTGMSPAQMLLGRELRDFLPGSRPKAHLTRHSDLMNTWQQVAEWRELALAPRGAKLHDKLNQGTKELTPLKIGDCVMMQNQLGNKPKRWDKRGVVVQADPKTRQYKVMIFGSRRLTLRNRRFLRKYTPAYTPPGTPTGLQLGARLGDKSSEQSPVQSGEGETRRGPGLSTGPLKSPPTTEQAPVAPATIRPQPQYSLPPAPEPAHQAESSEPAVLTEYSTPQYQAPMLPATPQVYRQIQQCPSQPMQVPVLTIPPPRPTQVPVSTRVSTRANKGQTSKYEDFVQHINLMPGTYACDGANLYKLEDTNSTNHQVWTPDTAYVQAVTHDRYQAPWIPSLWNKDAVTKQFQQQEDMINKFYNGSYLNNDVYGSYEAFRP